MLLASREYIRGMSADVVWQHKPDCVRWKSPDGLRRRHPMLTNIIIIIIIIRI